RYAVGQAVAGDVRVAVREDVAEPIGPVVRRQAPGRLLRGRGAVVRGRKAAAVEAHTRVDVPGDELHAQVVARVPAELRVQGRVLRAVVVHENRIGRLRIEAVGLEVRDRYEVVAGVPAACDARFELARAEAAVLDAHAAAEVARSGPCQHVDDAARVGAVHEALRTAQHLDALEVPGRQQAVERGRDAIGGRVHRLDAVDVKHRTVGFLAANAQRRRMPASAAVADPDPGLGAQHVGERRVAPELDLRSGDDGYGRADLAPRRR